MDRRRKRGRQTMVRSEITSEQGTSQGARTPTERKKEVAKSYGRVWGLGIACLPPETRTKSRKFKDEALNSPPLHITASAWRMGEWGLVMRLKVQINFGVKTPTCRETAPNCLLRRVWDTLATPVERRV